MQNTWGGNKKGTIGVGAQNQLNPTIETAQTICGPWNGSTSTNYCLLHTTYCTQLDPTFQQCCSMKLFLETFSSFVSYQYSIPKCFFLLQIPEANPDKPPASSRTWSLGQRVKTNSQHIIPHVCICYYCSLLAVQLDRVLSKYSGYDRDVILMLARAFSELPAFKKIKNLKEIPHALNEQKKLSPTQFPQNTKTND